MFSLLRSAGKLSPPQLAQGLRQYVGGSADSELYKIGSKEYDEAYARALPYLLDVDAPQSHVNFDTKWDDPEKDPGQHFLWSGTSSKGIHEFTIASPKQILEASMVFRGGIDSWRIRRAASNLVTDLSNLFGGKAYDEMLKLLKTPPVIYCSKQTKKEAAHDVLRYSKDPAYISAEAYEYAQLHWWPKLFDEHSLLRPAHDRRDVVGYGFSMGCRQLLMGRNALLELTYFRLTQEPYNYSLTEAATKTQELALSARLLLTGYAMGNWGVPAKEDTIEFAAPTVILFGQDDKGVKHPLSLSTTAIADHDPAEPYSINRVPRVHKYIKGAAEHLIMFGVNTLKDSAMPANSNGHGNYGLAANKYLSARALTHVQQMVLPRPETVPSPIPEVTAWQNNSHTTTIPGTERF